MKSSITERAWAAGFFYGEGSVNFKGKTKAGRLRQLWLSIQQNDRITLDRFKDAIGVGVVYGPYHPPSKQKSKPHYQFQTYYTRDTVAGIMRMWPYLRKLKREQTTGCYQQLKSYGTI